MNETITNKKITRSALLLLSAGSAALLAGCGGGGSNGNTVSTGTTNTGTTNTGTTNTGTTNTGTTNTGTNNTSQIAGKVTDITGRGLPGVSIAVDSGGQITTTISTGGYRLNNLSGPVAHKILASVTVGGVQYSGSTQVVTSPNNLVSNGNILVSPVSQQATVQGTVRDAGGNPVAGAGVYLAVPSVATATSAGNYSSLAAYTDSSGVYQITNVPAAGLPVGGLLMTASTLGSANQTATLAASVVTPGSTVTQNFTLAAFAKGTSVAADQPAVLGATAFTQPVDGLTTSAMQARLASGSAVSGTVYETLRRALSPSYAAYASRRHSLGKRLMPHLSGSGYAVEVDLAFNPPAATNVNLAGYNVYRSTGVLATNPISENLSMFGHDSLVDPLANYYVDVTTTSDRMSTANFNPYSANTTYNFALSAISTTGSESMLSNVVTLTPLGLLNLNAPAAGATVAGPVTLSWTPVANATKYYVFLYTQYPTIGTSAIDPSPAALPAGTASVTLTTLPAGTTYYAIVVATADQTEIVGATTPVTNAVQSYSEITPFTVQ